MNLRQDPVLLAERDYQDKLSANDAIVAQAFRAGKEASNELKAAFFAGDMSRTMTYMAWRDYISGSVIFSALDTHDAEKLNLQDRMFALVGKCAKAGDTEAIAIVGAVCGIYGKCVEEDAQ